MFMAKKYLLLFLLLACVGYAQAQEGNFSVTGITFEPAVGSWVVGQPVTVRTTVKNNLNEARPSVGFYTYTDYYVTDFLFNFKVLSCSQQDFGPLEEKIILSQLIPNRQGTYKVVASVNRFYRTDPSVDACLERDQPKAQSLGGFATDYAESLIDLGDNVLEVKANFGDATDLPLPPVNLSASNLTVVEAAPSGVAVPISADFRNNGSDKVNGVQGYLYIDKLGNDPVGGLTILSQQVVKAELFTLNPGETQTITAAYNFPESGYYRVNAAINTTSQDLVFGGGYARLYPNANSVDNLLAAKFISVNNDPVPAPPSVTINSPVNNQRIPAWSDVTLSATGSGGIAPLKYNWFYYDESTQVELPIGREETITYQFPPSTSTIRIRVRVTDYLGRQSTAEISNMKVAFTLDPIAAVISPTNGSVVSPNVKLVGEAYEPDKWGFAPFTYQWSSDISGVLGNSATLNTTLPLGIHQITFTLTDALGRKDSEVISVNVSEQALPPADEGGPLPEFKIVSSIVFSDSPAKDPTTNLGRLVTGTRIRAKVVLENTSDISVTRVPVAVYAVTVGQQNLISAEIPKYVDLPARSSQTVEVMIDEQMSAGVYTFYTVVNRNEVTVDKTVVKLGFRPIPELDPYNNTKVQSFVVETKCPEGNLTLGADGTAIDKDTYQSGTITVNAATLSAGKKLTLIARSSVLKPGFLAQAGSSVQVKVLSCVAVPSAARLANQANAVRSEEIVDTKKTVVYPNPFDQYLRIAFDGIVSVKICNGLGQLVQQWNNAPLDEKGVWTLNTAQLPPGVYYVQCVKKDGTVVGTKVIK
jgi:hypothetical protein